MKDNFKFSAEEKLRIEDAIQALEKESSGELVLYFAKKSDNYKEAAWISAALTALFVSVVYTLLAYYWLLPAFADSFFIGVSLICLMFLGALVPFFVPKIRLSFISDAKIYERVLTKGRDVFLQEEVFKTVDRTGILIYISKLEHVVEVLGDSGINSKIEQKDWEYIVGLILNGIKNEKTADGIVQAINGCKKLLLDNGFKVREDDTNELSNEIRVE